MRRPASEERNGAPEVHGQPPIVDWDTVIDELSQAIETGDAVQLPFGQMPADLEPVARDLLSRLDERIAETVAQMAQLDDERVRIVALRRAADTGSEPASDTVDFTL